MTGYLYLGIFLAIIIGYAIYTSNDKKIKTLRDLTKSFGKKPTDYTERFDMRFVRHNYISRVKHENDSTNNIDELTWNDLDMDNVFKRMNYTRTTLGEYYLYYKLRKIYNKEEELKSLDNLVEKIKNDKSLRNSINSNLIKLGKINDFNISNFIYNPEMNKIKNYYLYVVLSLLLLISILSSFFIKAASVPFIVLFFFINIYVHQKTRAYLESNFNTTIYLLSYLNIAKKLVKIKDIGFTDAKEDINSILTNTKGLTKLKIYGSLLGKNSTISELNFILDYLKVFFMLDIIAYKSLFTIFNKNKDNLWKIYDFISELDFAQSLAYYRESVPSYSNPQFTNDDTIDLKELYHPLIDEPIKNSITIKNNILFTGSNASGKSTFIKSVALNFILAQTTNTALCLLYKARPYKIVSSMAIKDDILAGDSYFIAEIKSLKRLLDSVNKDLPVLAFVDEILKGTNTLERISASASILNYIQNSNAKILVATHDIELTKILPEYDNYHFRETVTDDGISFDYKLHTGPSTTTNALKLLEALKFESSVVNLSNEVLNSFKDNQKWPIL